jgi:hypothetical protein
VSVTAEKILSEIKALAPDDVRELCQQVNQLAGQLDYGELSDGTLTALAAETFALLDKEETDAEPR